MPEPRDDRDIETLLSQMGEELAASGSIMPDVQARLTHVLIKSNRTRPWLMAVAAVLLVSAGVWLGRGWAGHRSDHDPGTVAASERIQTQCVVGDAVVIEHLASLIGRRAVLVVWSCQGADLTAARLSGPLSSGGREAHYSERVLAREQTSDGRTVVWSLFVAPANVQPVLEPPSIRVSTPDGRLLVLTASPRVTSREELVEALRSAGLPGTQRASLEDIEWVVEGT